MLVVLAALLEAWTAPWLAARRRLLLLSPMQTCEFHSDCALPEVCRKGLLFDFCCDVGGSLQPMRVRGNASFPQMPLPSAFF